MNRFDSETSYCRMLGNEVPFEYCRSAAEALPCRKIKDCWFEKLPVEAYMDKHYTREEQEKIFAPPVPKMASLLELIEKAKKAAAGTGVS